MLVNIKKKVKIIGAGLAGCEASLFLANHGVQVELYEMKPNKMTPAHKNKDFGELVCSNSLKSEDVSTASGLLKKELELLGCSLLKIAKETSVEAGSALAVDRELFAKSITNAVESNPNIKVFKNVCIEQFDTSENVIIATGPLTDDKLFNFLSTLLGEQNCYFYDAIAPIIETSSIDMSKAFWGNRYNKGTNDGDYLNIALDKNQYLNFYNQLITAQRIELKSFEKVFEGCMAVEVMAKRGVDALRYGPMKPVGFDLPTKPYAVLQLRKENKDATSVNMVGFQTNLIFSEQKRVFSLLPGLENAKFLRYGQMHRNSYINAPSCLTGYSSLKNYPNIFVAGQLSGVEGYMESIASGLYCAYNMLRFLDNKQNYPLERNTMLGAIIDYITSASEKNFQPMNANFGIISVDKPIKDKKEKKEYILENSLKQVQKWRDEEWI